MDALLPPLPGAGELDEALVARAAADITSIYEVNGLRTFLEAAVSELFSQLQLSDEVVMQLVDQIDQAIVGLQELRHDLVRSVPGR